METMKTIKIFAAACLLIGTVCSCDDFLSEEPSKNSLKTIQTAEQLDAIMGNFHYFCQESATMCMPTDDMYIGTEIQLNKKWSNGGYHAYDLQFALWSDQLDAPNNWINVWCEEYERIYYANLVLGNIDKVSGDETLKDNLKKEAYFIRAYAYFNLALAHTLYYDGTNGGELGLPMKLSTSFEESCARGTLEQLWKQIDSDLEACLDIKKELVPSNGATKTCWRASKPAVHALAARIHLYKGDYDKALEYAEQALSEYNLIEDYNTALSFDGASPSSSATYEGEVIMFNRPLFQEYFVQLGYGNVTPLFNWKDCIYYRTIFYMSEWFIPTPELLATYAADVPDGNLKNDLRYKFFMPEHYSLRMSKKGYFYPGYVQISGAEMFTGLMVGEVMLIKAEALARTGNYAEGMSVLNSLRKNRIAAGAYADLTAGSQEEAVKKILQERRREMPFYMRWYDLKRLNANETAYDDVTVTRQFFPYTTAGVLEGDAVQTYTLEPGSRHYAMPIPEFEMNRAEGRIQQNTY